MAGFKVVKDLDEAAFERVDVSSLTAAVGDLLERTAGSTTWAKCTSSSNFFTVKGILQEALTSASTALIYRLNGREVVEADATNAANAAHNGDRMALTDENAVNNSGSDSTGQAVAFVQEGVLATSFGQKILGRVLVGNGVDPDAS